MSAPSSKDTWLTIPYVTPGEMYAATIVLPILGIILVAVRLQRRFKTDVGMGADDWLIIPALLLTISTAVTLLIGVQGGAIAAPTPYDPSETPEEEMTAVNPTISLMGKVQYATLLQLTLAYGFLKLSISFLCRRLFVVRKWSPFDWACWITIGITIVWMVAFFLALVFNCGTRVDANWGSVQDLVTYCHSAGPVQDALVTSDLITDVIVWALPLPMIFQLHMTWTRKLAVVGVMALGAISVVASIIKVVINFEIDSHGLSTDVDPDLTVSTIMYWFFVEAGLGIIATCLPMLYHYFAASEPLSRWLASMRTAMASSSLPSSQNSRGGNSNGSLASFAKERDYESGMSDQTYMATRRGRWEDPEAAFPPEYRIAVTHALSQRSSAAVPDRR